MNFLGHLIERNLRSLQCNWSLIQFDAIIS